MESNKRIVLNQVQCLECNTILKSFNRHHFNQCKCPNETFVDGGFEYVRVGGKDLSKVSELTLYNTDPHNILRDFCEWGVLNTKNNSHNFVKIKDLGDDHLEELIKYNYISDDYRKIMTDEKEFRLNKKNNL
jgi:hypothetical protein